jgi:hypothetical protein
MIYSDSQLTIHKLKNTPGFTLVAEVFKEEKVIAALFKKER